MPSWAWIVQAFLELLKLLPEVLKYFKAQPTSEAKKEAVSEFSGKVRSEILNKGVGSAPETLKL